MVGEYDWTNRTYLSWRFAWFLLLLPLLSAILVTWAAPKRCWPIRTTPLRILTCGACRGARRRKRANKGASTRAVSAASSSEQDLPSTVHLQRRDTNEDLDKSFTPFASSDRLPILETSRTDEVIYPPPRTSIRGGGTSSRSPCAASRLLRQPLTIKRWHVFPIPFLVLLPMLIPLLIIYLPSPIGSFLSSLATDSRVPDASSGPRVAGDLWWSLFGRTDTCDAYVQHNDGYTLHYPAFPAGDVEQSTSSFLSDGSGRSVLELTKHSWTVRGETPFWLNGTSGAAANELTWELLPVISCPQESLKWPNGTSID